MNRAERRRAARTTTSTDPISGIWYSNAAFVNSGYGTQTRQVVTRMLADGHDIAVAANYGLEQITSEWEGITHLPRGYDGYSQDVAAAYFKDWTHAHPGRPVAFTLFDAWVLTSPLFDEARTVSWVPIDHMPTPPKVLAYCAKPTVTPVAMAKYGSLQLTDAGIDHVYIPHGIETDIYTPTPWVEDGAGVRRTGRDLMGGIDPGAHVTGIVNANKGTSPVRKAFGEQLLAWKVFARDKDDAVLYLHTELSGSMGGIAFEPLLQALAIPPEKLRWANPYQLRMGIPSDVLAAMYTGMDVLLAPTLGEGFGLTVAEAGACGTRQIVSDFTAQPELVVDGWKVGGQPLWDANHAAWFLTPNVEQITRALEESYERRHDGPSTVSRQHIIDNYDATTVYRDLWRPLLESL